MASNLKVHTFQEVSKHNTKKDCWLIIHGKVYDMTSYLDDHPGGDEVLVIATGQDATEDFEDAGHSKTARELMETHLIGEIDVTTLPVKDKQKQTTNASGDNESTSTFFIKMLPFVLPLLILVLAFALREYV